MFYSVVEAVRQKPLAAFAWKLHMMDAKGIMLSTVVTDAAWPEVVERARAAIGSRLGSLGCAKVYIFGDPTGAQGEDRELFVTNPRDWETGQHFTVDTRTVPIPLLLVHDDAARLDVVRYVDGLRADSPRRLKGAAAVVHTRNPYQLFTDAFVVFTADLSTPDAEEGKASIAAGTYLVTNTQTSDALITMTLRPAERYNDPDHPPVTYVVADFNRGVCMDPRYIEWPKTASVADLHALLP